jgi:hypothetical protein
MMRREDRSASGALLCYPGHDTVPAVRIGYDVAVDDQHQMTADFRVHGAVDTLLLPAFAGARRADALWKHSCFEIFLKRENRADYQEFNFAPDGGWAAYGFSGYRAGMHNLDGFDAPIVSIQQTPTAYHLRAQFSVKAFAALANLHIWRLGVSAVIEDIGGANTYWAVAHPDGPADFHHDVSFSQNLVQSK